MLSGQQYALILEKVLLQRLRSSSSALASSLKLQFCLLFILHKRIENQTDEREISIEETEESGRCVGHIITHAPNASSSTGYKLLKGRTKRTGRKNMFKDQL